MKKIVLFLMMMLPMAVMGQKDVTTFLGIPVDGSKSSMIQKLKNKGFLPLLFAPGFLILAWTATRFCACRNFRGMT